MIICPNCKRELNDNTGLNTVTCQLKLGYKDAFDDAFDWLIERYENQGVILLEDINELKKYMEEQQ